CGGALRPFELDARIRIAQVAGLGAEVVVVDADAEAVGDVPAGAHPGIPAVAAVAAPALQPQLLADPVVIARVVVGGAEVAAAQADIPRRGQVGTGVCAHMPATQCVLVLALVDAVVTEDVAHLQVAQVGIAAFDTQAPHRRDLPAVAAGQSVSGPAAVTAFEDVEIAGAKARGGAASGAPHISGDEPVAIARLQVGAVVVAATGLGGGNGGKRHGRKRGGNEQLVHRNAPYFLLCFFRGAGSTTRFA